VVNRLGRIGSQVVVAYRGEESSFRHLKVMGDLGQIVPAWYDIRDPDTIKRAVQYSNVVINLVGKRYETRNFSFDDVHVAGAAAIAKAAKEAGVERFIHVSALGADENSRSGFAKSKAIGEKVVREIIPGATILRPAALVGQRDYLLSKFGMMVRYWPFFLRVLKDTRFQPLAAGDMATALMNALASPETVGKDYELAGPEVWTMKEMTEFVSRQTVTRIPFVDAPLAPVRLLSKTTQMFLRKPRYTAEELDFWNHANMTLSPEAKHTIEDLGLTKDDLMTMETSAGFLRQFRRPAHIGLIVDEEHHHTEKARSA